MGAAGSLHTAHTPGQRALGLSGAGLLCFLFTVSMCHSNAMTHEPVQSGDPFPLGGQHSLSERLPQCPPDTGSARECSARTGKSIDLELSIGFRARLCC